MSLKYNIELFLLVDFSNKPFGEIVRNAPEVFCIVGIVKHAPFYTLRVLNMKIESFFRPANWNVTGPHYIGLYLVRKSN